MDSWMKQHYQHRVNSLTVLSCDKDRGYGWQGDLACFHQLVQSCDASFTTEQPIEIGRTRETHVMKSEPLTRGAPDIMYSRTVSEQPTVTSTKAIDNESGASKLPANASSKLFAAQQRKAETLPKPRKLKVCFGFRKTPPCPMERGSAASDDQYGYFAPRNSTSVYRHEYSTEKWDVLPSCPYQNSGLVVIDGELTAVGGSDKSGSTTNKLFTLQQGKWVEKYPPMNTANESPAVVSRSDGTLIIVIGGISNGKTTVELFEVKSKRWYKLTGLPQLLPRPSAAVHGDIMYVIGSDRIGFSCSLRALPPSGTSPLTLSWKPIPPLPVVDTTAATLSGQLVLVGGAFVPKENSQATTQSRNSTHEMSPVGTIHQLFMGEWVEVDGSMTSPRRRCLVASAKVSTIFIVNGYETNDSGELCTVI